MMKVGEEVLRLKQMDKVGFVEHYRLGIFNKGGELKKGEC